MELKDNLKKAIEMMSKRFKIEPKSLRIRISKPEKDLIYEIMSNSEVRGTANIAEVFNLNAVTAFVANSKLNKIFDNLSSVHHVPKNKMNVRIYTKDNTFHPSLYLFDDTTAKKALELNDFK